MQITGANEVRRPISVSRESSLARSLIFSRVNPAFRNTSSSWHPLSRCVAAMAAVVAAPFTASEAAVPVAKPVIYFMGEDINGKTTHVMIGEQIALTTSPLPPNALAPGWGASNVDGYGPIGGFQHSGKCAISPATGPVCDGPVAANFSGPTTTLYFIVPGTYTLVYSYNVGDSYPEAFTTFKVGAPTNVAITATFGAAQIELDHGKYFLSFGSALTGHPGVEFNVSAHDAGAGKFLWAQLITNSEFAYARNDRDGVCNILSGLDNTFPYSEHDRPEADDSPEFNITGDTAATVTVAAIMYSLWQSNKPMSIPVPLGYAQWGVVMRTEQVNNSWPNPAYTVEGPSIGYENSAYPIWNSVALNNTPCHKT